jgi:hypothetical protein
MGLFKMPAPKPRLARNGFDLSSRRIFSAKAGQLLPIGCWEVNPSEHFKFSVQDLVRTTTLNTASYARMKEYYHFFFVSYRSLWQWFDQFIVGTNNPHSALNGVKKNGTTNYNQICSSVPTFDLGKLITRLKTSDMDSQGFNYSEGAAKLLNMLNYGVTNKGKFMNLENLITSTAYLPSKDDKEPSSTYACKVSPFRLLAYQKIFNDFYRNQDWTPSDVRSFNVDDYADDSNLTIEPDVALKFCQMRYRPYAKDWLTSMKPTPNYSDGIFNLPEYVRGNGNVILTNNKSGSVSLDGSSNSSNSFSVNDLRAAFALDKMLEATRRANGLDYASQIEAHFGFKVPESRANDARFLGGFDNSIVVSEVVSTNGNAASDGSHASIGDLGGKGIGSLSSGTIEFDSTEHGIIMCIYSVAPQSEYNASYLDPFNRKLTREQFYQPEFADLGYQALIGSDLICSTLGMNQTQAGFSDIELNNNLLGYQVRYNEYKTARDLVFGDFESGKSLSYWCTPRFDFGYGDTDKKIAPENKGGADYRKKGNRSHWSSRNFYINPNLVNPIFLTSAVQADHFIVNSFLDVKAVRPMSVTGLSSL